MNTFKIKVWHKTLTYHKSKMREIIYIGNGLNRWNKWLAENYIFQINILKN